MGEAITLPGAGLCWRWRGLVGALSAFRRAGLNCGPGFPMVPRLASLAPCLIPFGTSPGPKWSTVSRFKVYFMPLPVRLRLIRSAFRIPQPMGRVRALLASLGLR